MQFMAISLSEGIRKARKGLLKMGSVVKTQIWQGKENPPSFIEFLHMSLCVPMAQSEEEASFETCADQPWAKIHFGERISGEPLNPPPSHTMWRTKTEEYFSGDMPNAFSHSYPERLWPKSLLPSGIRFETADLSTAVEVLKKDPTTRQCYIPLYFPEDLSASLAGERVPCTLGWHFIIRNDRLHCFYPMRSCDAIRHFHNDLYFANCLGLWLLESAGLSKSVSMGSLHFSATSFHCFENDRYTLEKLTRHVHNHS